MKSLIILLMLASSAFPQEPARIKISISNEDWGKLSHIITRLMGMPTMQGTEVLGGPRQFSDGTKVSYGERVVYRQSLWVKGTTAVSARTKVAPETEAIEAEITITDSAESSESDKNPSRRKGR